VLLSSCRGSASDQLYESAAMVWGASRGFCSACASLLVRLSSTVLLSSCRGSGSTSFRESPPWCQGASIASCWSRGPGRKYAAARRVIHANYAHVAAVGTLLIATPVRPSGGDRCAVYSLAAVGGLRWLPPRGWRNYMHMHMCR
jgi:hypothetical protein